MNLTAQTIKNAKPTKKVRELFDGEGLYLEISPTGRKWWRLKYRFSGKEKRVSLVVYPDVTLTEARKRRYQAKSYSKIASIGLSNQLTVLIGRRCVDDLVRYSRRISAGTNRGKSSALQVIHV